MDASNGLQPFAVRIQAANVERRMMAIMSLDGARASVTPASSLLLVIDAQVGRLWEMEFARRRTCLAALASAALAQGVPTIVTTIASRRWGPTIPAIAVCAQTLIERRVVNPWREPRVRSAVAAAARPTLIIAGGSPESSLTSCALSALDAGYNVCTAIDVSVRANRRRAARMIRAGVTVADPASLLAELRLNVPASRMRA